MRYFLALLALLVVLAVSLLGCRGSFFRRPPLQVFRDMKEQPKARPQSPSAVFADQRSSRLPVAGTIPRGLPMVTPAGTMYPFEEHPVNTGRVPGSTNFIELNPLPVTEQQMARGRARFEIHCMPCHGAQADGNGITKKLGMGVIANLHDNRIVRLPDGDLFNTVSRGKNLMPAYGADIDIADRWAILSYLRALQWSKLGTTHDVPAEARVLLKR